MTDCQPAARRALSSTTSAGLVSAAPSQAKRALDDQPDRNVQETGAILGATPACAEALNLQGCAPAARKDFRAARARLAAEADLRPMTPGVWRALADVCVELGDGPAADAAYLRHVETAVGDAELMTAADALAANRLDVAEAGLRARLKSAPTDVAAIRMLAELAARLGRYTDAEALLARALDLAPSFVAARRNYAVVLYRQMKAEAALSQIAELKRLIRGEPGDRMLEAGAMALVGDYLGAVAVYEDLLRDHPAQPKLWLSYGHALKTLGRGADSLAAYRRCLALAPGLGEAWWSIANLKTARFTPEERARLEVQADAPGHTDEDRLHLDYALGKALEDESAFDRAFDRYARGAAAQRARLNYDADATSAQTAQTAAVFSWELIAARAGQGCPAADPIFIVGLPRSGSTLIEQILASHSKVEGTMELPELPALARRIAETAGGAYPGAVASLSPDALAAFGREYLDRTRIYRRTTRPLFIDKMPNNWLHAGLIRLILPNAKIIDARRHPMASCFSAFKQHFARGQAFSYGLEDLGRYYQDYVALMDHFDHAMPGAVHRVIYEDLIEDTEAQVRRLLAACGLAFEPACLRFFETERPVRTASSEQVRRPIYREGLEQWRRFEAHLAPLRSALGPALETWASPPM